MQPTDPFGWAGATLDNKVAIESVVGEGGFGVVYRGVHLGFELPVAVKCLRLPPGVGAQERERLLAQFRAEARLLHRLSRRTASIVQALDIGAASSPRGPWTPYIVMEWLEGETLASNLRRRRASGEGPRGLDDAIRLLAPAAAALAIAHEEKVSHRDVKPANLFLAASGASTTLKILDFGIAKVLSEATLQSGQRTQPGTALPPFTPQYGAPEQFSGRFGPTGPWTDVFAMALVLLEVASGQAGLAGDDVIQLYTAAVEESSRPSLAARGVRASPAVEAVLSRALAPSPRLRFRDLGEMWAALTAAQGASTSSLPPAPPGSAASARGEPPGWDLQRTAPAAPATGENRVCTVMFVDLAEATALSARLAPEDVKEIVDRCFAAVKEQVEAMGGLVEELPGGDQAMALFGVPRATDNDAERAVHAALRVQAALARAALPRALRGARLSARIGITTGRVFAEPAGGGARPRFTVLGEAVTTARSLQQTAPKGAIAIGRDTYRLVVNRFEIEPLAPVEVAGRSEALPAYQVRGPAGLRPVMAISDFHGVDTKLVGRAAEMQRLTEALETVLSEQRACLVTLVGAPGVGRTRVLAGLFARLILRREEDLVVMVAQASPLLRSTSYGLVASMIRRRFEIGEGDPLGVVMRKLRRGMRWLRLRGALRRSAEERELGRARGEAAPRASAEGLEPADLEDALRQVAAILGAREADEAATVALDEAGNPARQRIFAAVARLLRFAADTAPIAILCDDIQWADGASLDLIEDLLVRAEDLPVLAVCAARPELFERLPAWGEGKAGHVRVDLAPLPRRHMEEMVRDWLRRVPALSPAVVRTLADRAEGHPLTLAETLHLLVDAGVIEPRGEEPWAIREEQLGELALALPTTVQGIVQARLDRLEAEPRSMLAQAAVVGRTFWEGALERLQRPEPGGAPEAAPAELLAQLRHRQLIRPRESAMFPGEREYVFAESAMYEVAYEMLSVKVRRPLHLVIARWLEERASGSAGHALLALHYDRGGDARRAAAAYVRAAAHAASLGENAEALRQLERARDLHDEVLEEGGAGGDGGRGGDARGGERGGGDERGGEQGGGDGRGGEQGGGEGEGRGIPWRESVRLRLDLGDVLRRLGRLDEAERTYEEARARIVRPARRGGAPRPGEQADAADALRFEARVDHRLALVHKVRGATAEARPLVERAIARAKEAGAVEETPAMYALLAFLHRRERRPDASWAAAREGLRVCRKIERHDERWQENVAQLLFGVGASLFGRGRLVGAERSYRQAARVISEATSPYLAGIALNGVGAMRFMQGDRTGARAIYLRALRLKERAGDLHQIAVTCTNLAEVELQLKEFPAALEHARRAVRLSEQARAGSDLAAMYRNLADVLLAAGELEEALTTGRKALATAEVAGRVYLSEAALTLARACARAANDPSSDAGLRARAAEAAGALRASLSAHFTEGELRQRAEECERILEHGIAKAD
ncbi:protein kinase domain-containing protein [Sorangium sp. So ce131]|uniref:protein kinase domain-containing protein n=1 Tax=Sorangium sp. So ce131 TaxID=3133282 RepID=UPI003F5EAB25